MADDDVRQIELRRLHELERQAALYGPNTEPAILVEIQDLRHKYGSQGPISARIAGRDRSIDYDFLMNTVASALQRLTSLEQFVREDAAHRPKRQFILNVWLGAISLGVVVSIALSLWFAQRLFGL